LAIQSNNTTGRLQNNELPGSSCTVKCPLHAPSVHTYSRAFSLHDLLTDILPWSEKEAV